MRLLFQPAEEVVEGALVAMRDGAINDVDRLFALHCDPRFEVGTVGPAAGADHRRLRQDQVRVSGPGGHTARPHLTADLVYALGKIVTELPAALSRRVDPRSSLSLVWGQMSAGSALNAIPEVGMAEGTVRCLDDDAWHQAPDLLKALLNSVANAYGVVAELDYIRGVPPAVNDAGCVDILEEAVAEAVGPDAATQAQQSLGGEDVAWYFESIPGALARLGTRGTETPTDLDIHQANFDIDEKAIGVGVEGDGDRRADRPGRRGAAGPGRRPGPGSAEPFRPTSPGAVTIMPRTVISEIRARSGRRLRTSAVDGNSTRMSDTRALRVLGEFRPAP